MNEKTLMILHYTTGLGILVFGAIHVAVVFLTAPVDVNLAFDNSPFSIINVYRNVFLALSLEGLLICTSFHAFNGLRVILMELTPSRTLRRVASIIMVLLAIVLTVYGTRTILIAHLLR